MAREKRTTVASPETVSVTDFKAKCLGFFEETARTGREFTVTKKGKAVAKVVPAAKTSATIKGSLKGLAEIRGDIVSFDSSKDWEVLKK